MRGLLFAPLLLLTGCGALDASVGCDFRDGSLAGPEARCQERSGAQASGFDAMCEGLGATPIDGGCEMEGVVAGCETLAAGAAGQIVDWYYEPTTPAEVDESCEGEGTVIEP